MLPDARAESGGPPAPPGLELLSTLARAILGLVEADTDDAVLRAVASLASAYGPAVIRLYTLRDDPGAGPAGDARMSGGRAAAVPGAIPTHAELASVWQTGVCPAEDPLLGRPFALADHPILARWLAAPTRPLVLHDLAADPLAAAQPGATQALVVLPLRVGDPARWPGLLVLSWKIVHIPGPRERLAYSLLARVVASLLADRDALRAHQRALDEANTVHVVALALADTAAHDDILAALAEPAHAVDASAAALWLRDPERPDRLVLRAAAGGEFGDIGVAERPLAALAGLFARANEPWLFEQAPAGELAIEAGAPTSAGLAGAVLLPLAWSGYKAGLVELRWPSPRLIPAGLRRLHGALAGAAAISLAGELLLAAAARPGADLTGVPAAVLVVDVPSGIVSAGNPAGEGVLARGGDDLESTLRGVMHGEARLSLVVADSGTTTELALFTRDDPGERRRIAVVLDTTAHRQAERARQRARDELLRSQATLLARRAVPAISLADGVVVVPVVGSLDGARARQLADVLAAVAAPCTVILDFTGVTAVDPAAVPQVHAAARALVDRDVAVTLTSVPDALDGDLDLERAATLGEAIAAALVAAALT